MLSAGLLSLTLRLIIVNIYGLESVPPETVQTALLLLKVKFTASWIKRRHSMSPGLRFLVGKENPPMALDECGSLILCAVIFEV